MTDDEGLGHHGPKDRDRVGKPMSEGMIKRVARALCAQAMKLPPDNPGVDVFWTEYFDPARAAIEAMRDPGWKVLMDGYHATGRFGETWGALNEIWNAQIDEALK